jgi:hypothetical protein
VGAGVIVISIARRWEEAQLRRAVSRRRAEGHAPMSQPSSIVPVQHEMALQPVDRSQKHRGSRPSCADFRQAFTRPSVGEDSERAPATALVTA